MIITAASHLDHGLTEDQIMFLSKRFVDRDAFFIESIELPEELGTVSCSLYGPAMGDAAIPDSEVSYAIRGDRRNASRLVDLPSRPTRTITVIAGPHEDAACVLYTAFGGPATPKEPGDLSLEIDKIAESRDFWAKHALANRTGFPSL
jgi:hypothetical protein